MVDYPFPQTQFPSQAISDYYGEMGLRYIERFGAAKPNPQPSPYNFKIVESLQVGQFLVVQVNYPNCTNYEGNKILLYDGIDIEFLIKQNYIDPHFSEDKKLRHPIARFEPTSSGWSNAVKLCELLKSEQLDCPNCPF